ncbi:hypothetical protein [Alloalcanivorax gelatiniphagus]|uniref:hypothetical protein n=1 Tax=Alloalcanivorax gelatiniphagus TaxID=1194167 RepID=UPI00361CC576
MDTDIKKLIGGGVLALLLTACGGGGGGGGGDSAGTPTPSTRELPQEMAAVVDQSNEFTNEFCPETSGGQAPGASVDPAACVGEAQALDSGAPDPTSVVAQFCPVAAGSFDLAGLFDPTAFLDNLQDPQALLTDGPLTFPLACLQESAGNLGQLQDLIGGSNPITEQLCPQAAAAGSFDPATCLSEIAGGAGGGLPQFPGTGGGGAPSIPGADGFCPTTSGGEFGPTTVIDCLNEITRVYVTIVDQIRTPNPISEAVCPLEHASGLVDPVACLKEGLAGTGLPALPGLGDLPGLPGGGGGEGPGVPPELGDALGAICPDALAGEIGPTTPIDCLTEAGGNLGGLTDLLGGLGGSNPLTDALCPAASGTGSLDPAACITEALGNLPGAPGGDGGVPEIPGLGDGLAQICPNAAEAGLSPTLPLICLMEVGGNFGQLQDLLGGLGGGLGGREAGAEPVTAELCPEAGAGGLSPTLPLECLLEAGQNLPDLLTGLLGGLAP